MGLDISIKMKLFSIFLLSVAPFLIDYHFPSNLGLGMIIISTISALLLAFNLSKKVQRSKKLDEQEALRLSTAADLGQY